MSLLKDFHELSKQQKEEHFLKILNKSMGVLDDEDKFNQIQNSSILGYVEKGEILKQREKKLACMEKYNKVFEEYQNKINKEKEDKIQSYQIVLIQLIENRIKLLRMQLRIINQISI
ncbi:unnamed protein product [Paramecium octaurelia]|uniref:Uncharacterized protein n=1 Tax=Paramecium octaurelia TaxID=43137 RepID=A0A8S1TT38_PAROT|nr:unnamed protein product [Paramecium octaurelia]